jgi:phosphoserine phosphatase
VSTQTILVRVSGPDRPGITAALMTVLADAGADVEDVEQIVIRGRLSLGLVVSVPPGGDVLKELLLFGWEQGVDVDFEVVEATPTPARRPGAVVTIMGRRVCPAEFAAAARIIADHGGNIDRIVRLGRYPVMAYELAVTGGDTDGMKQALLAAGLELECDIAVQREGLGRRAARLVVLDVDSTLIQDEIIELLAEEAGCGAEVAGITARAMAGELDFRQALEQRVGLLAGLDAGVLERVRDKIRLTPGARTFVRTLRRLGFRTAIVSGGFDAVTEPLRRELGLDYAYANRLEVAGGRLTGRLEGPVIDRPRKAEIMAEIAGREGIALDQVVAIGDGANDLDMLSAAGLGIAFNAKPVVRRAADTAVTVPFLDAVLFVLGVRREDIDDADLAEGIPPGPPIPQPTVVDPPGGGKSPQVG